jgi:hypothetical protein
MKNQPEGRKRHNQTINDNRQTEVIRTQAATGSDDPEIDDGPVNPGPGG